jgi:hypothetical protein
MTAVKVKENPCATQHQNPDKSQSKDGSNK